jgi:hypothetical protein
VIINLKKKIKMKKRLFKSVKIGLAALILGGLVLANAPVFAGDPPISGNPPTMPRPIPPPPSR